MKVLSGITLIAALTLTACSSTTDAAKAKEIPNVSQSTSDSPQDSLAHHGKKLFATGMYKVAGEQFESLKNSYPVGAYREFAELKAADAKYASGDYTQAAVAYEEFTKNNPHSSANAYAVIQTARSYQMSNNGTGRDGTPLESAANYYETLLTSYPDSLYTETAAENLLMITNQLAENERTIIDYYHKRNQEKAAAARQAYYDKVWVPLVEQRTALTNLYKSGLDSTSMKASFKGTTTPKQRETTAFRQNQFLPKEAIKLPLRTGNFECDKVKQELSIGLSRLMTNQEYSETVKSNGISSSYLTFTINEASGIPIEASCLTSGDLSIAENGVVKLKVAATVKAEFYSAPNPPRLIVTINQLNKTNQSSNNSNQSSYSSDQSSHGH